jgi:hypothetical protein
MTSAFYLNPTDRARLEEIIADRNSPRNWVWRADIVLATGDAGRNLLPPCSPNRRASAPCSRSWVQSTVLRLKSRNRLDETDLEAMFAKVARQLERGTQSRTPLKVRPPRFN